MIVCHCKAITDRQIRQAVLEGALTRTEVQRVCSAGGDCGGCHPLIDQLLGKEVATRQTEPRQRTP